MISKTISQTGPGGRVAGKVIVTENPAFEDATYPFPYSASMEIEGKPFSGIGDDSGPAFNDLDTLEEVLAAVASATKQVTKEVTRLSQIPPEKTVEEVLRELGFE